MNGPYRIANKSVLVADSPSNCGMAMSAATMQTTSATAESRVSVALRYTILMVLTAGQVRRENQAWPPPQPSQPSRTHTLKLKWDHAVS